MVKIGDIVRTNPQWNKTDPPIQGVVTRIDYIYGENDRLPLIELNGGEYRINEFWLEIVNDDWLDMC